MSTNKSRLVFLIPFFADRAPVYLPLFLKSAGYNKQFTFYFFTNLSLKSSLPANVVVHQMSFEELNQLVEEKVQVDVNIADPYKLCDLKPLYGQVFEEYTKEFDYWGFCDVDLILGNLAKFILEPRLLDKYDVASFRKEWLSGSLAIFRNTPEVNHLYKRSRDWQKVLSVKEYMGFDEVSRTLNSKAGLFTDLMGGKKLESIETEIESLTHVLRFKASDMRVHFETQVKESIARGMTLKFEEGRVLIEKGGESGFQPFQEFLHYHFVVEKKKLFFTFPNWTEVPGTFFITQFGFHRNSNKIRAEIFFRWLMVIFTKLPLVLVGGVRRKMRNRYW